MNNNFPDMTGHDASTGGRSNARFIPEKWESASRHEVQKTSLNSLYGDSSLPGNMDSLDVAFRAFAYPTDRAEEPEPLTPVVYLFNVLVAMEWQPTASYMNALHEGFRTASELLYNISGGSLAFGQVMFGGCQLMNAADIQLMVSNRFHPRAWAGGLHEPQKYMPIRVGRSLWQGRNKRSLPWNDVVGRNVLVHEWVHYALFLKDKYLESTTVSYQGVTYTLVRPISEYTSDDIMQNVEDLNPGLSVRGRRQRILTSIQEYFPDLPLERLGLDPQPSHLRLEVPAFFLLPGIEVRDDDDATSDRLVPVPTELLALHPLPHADQCWVYLLKMDGGADAFKCLVPHGSLEVAEDASTEGRTTVLAGDTFHVYGAEEGDFIILQVSNPGQDTPLAVFCGELIADKVSWRSATPELNGDKPRVPMIAIVPTAAEVYEKGNVTLAQVRLHVAPYGGVLPKKRSEKVKVVLNGAA